MRAFIALCLRRPVSVTAFFIAVLLAATVAYERLPVALLPSLDYPALAIWTSFPDAPPERVEQAVTEPIEQVVAATPGLRHLLARSFLGGSLIRLDFGWQTDMNLAMLEVRQQLDRLGDRLPETARRPVILRMDPSERPILYLALRERAADEKAPQDLVQLKRLAREVVARRLEQLEGVARVQVTGGYDREVHIRVREDRLQAYGLNLNTLEQALKTTNVALTGGLIRQGPFQYAVEISGTFQALEDIRKVVLHRPGAPPLRLEEVAEIREGVAERLGMVRLNGQETLLLLVERTPEANTVRTVEAVREVLKQLETELPRITLQVVVDESRFVREAIDGVVQAVWLGGLLAVLVLLIFLRRLRALLAVALAIPLSLALTLVLFDRFGVTFNLLSLGGLALGVGMLVDNAIIVVENIYRLREEGLDRLTAALEGTAQVAGAITASTLTTVAVFLPLSFVEGLAGRLFRDQSLAVTFSLLASLFVALTAVAVLLSRPERRATAPQPLRGFRGIIDRYETLLQWAMTHRSAVLLMALGLLLAGGLVFLTLPREVVPPAEQGRVDIHLTMPPGTDLALLDARARALTRRLLAHPGVAHVLADLGQRDEALLSAHPRPPYEGLLTVGLLPHRLSSSALTRWLDTLQLAPDVTLTVQPARTQLEELLLPYEAQLFIDLEGEHRASMERAAKDLLRALHEAPALMNLHRLYGEALPAYRLHFRQEAMMRFGLSTEQLSAYLEASARGRRATLWERTNETIPVLLKTPRRGSLDALLKERIPAGETFLPLQVFVEAESLRVPAALLRLDQMPVIRLAADVAPGYDLSAAVRTVERLGAAHVPANVRLKVGGTTEAFSRSLHAVLWSLLLSVVLVYLILAAQFESLLQPLIILSVVPLGLATVALVLAATGQSLNLMSLTGTVVLVGIMVNDAIVKVDFINQRRRAGMPLEAAIYAAGRARFRPIVLTTLTTVLGLLPLAMGWGPGGELRAPLAIAIAGGLAFATLITLFIVPIIYRLLYAPSH